MPWILCFRCRAPAHATLVLAPHSQPLLRTELQLPIQLRTRLLPVNKIAEASSYAALTAIESATSFSKIRDRAQLAVDRPRRIPSRVQRTILVFESCIYVADQMVIVIVAYYHLKVMGK